MGAAAVIRFSCPGCQQLIKLPADAAGRRARCGSCKEVIRVPAAAEAARPPAASPPPASSPRPAAVAVEDELGDFLSDLLAEDRDPDRSDPFARPKRYQKPPSASRSAGGDPDDLDELCDEDARALRSLKDRPAAASSAPAAGAADEPAPAAPAAAPKPAPAPTPATAAPAPAGFPTDPNPGPFLEVRAISALGVRLAFPAAQLKDPRFRASTPSLCVFSGQEIGPGSYARPMVFNNHHGEGDERVRMVELRHETTVGKAFDPAGFVNETAKLKEMPDPFDLPLPYAVSAGHHDSSLRCDAHVSTRHGGYCEVVIPSPEAALAWVGNVNGVCHPGYALLEEKGLRVSSEAWVRLPQSTRDRITMWCTFRRGEHFLAYARDSHSTAKDAGLGGVLVTDQRLVFHLFRTTWSMDLKKKIVLYSRARGETFGLAARLESEEMKPMCNVLRGEAALLFEALEDAAANLTVESENEGLSAAA